MTLTYGPYGQAEAVSCGNTPARKLRPGFTELPSKTQYSVYILLFIIPTQRKELADTRSVMDFNIEVCFFLIILTI